MADQPSERLRELFEQRRRKADALRERGIDPYPPRTAAKLTPVATARARFERWEQGALKRQPSAHVGGRVTSVRDLGKLAFLDLRDGSGVIQLLCRRDRLGESGAAVLKALDLGDFVEFERTADPHQNGRDLR